MQKTTPLAKTLFGILYERASRAENRPDVCPTRASILLFFRAKYFNLLIIAQRFEITLYLADFSRRIFFGSEVIEGDKLRAEFRNMMVN